MRSPRADEAKFAIIYRDEHLLVLNKPSGLLAVPGRGPDLQDCLSARAQHEFPTALVVHRLDRDTSGVFLMALNADTQRALNRQFAAQAVAKRYVAVVFGSPTADQGVIELPMRKDFDNPPRHMIDVEQGRAARTEWRVIERQADCARLEVSPKTGRSHQIRLHLQSIGHPILGDNLYAHAQALAMADRLLLHAEELSLTHPATGQEITWRSPCPF